ncbi:MotA/TolQ/ExbB proton channel [Methanococcus vannielii SB]|uniref:MotA/TolQ/ExbB proton channel n=1 Tax=Methanococcus vannielii (strain ATCC 35089 / DSM 1224 / JCM 13029 / OCM 148 / SB) TaxID=406327 RepID=A6UNL9_METVS|nr:MotA/TolQ/ExbB proton channel family protein [Methanococcus vannielii]ABR54091.1 MotA/TolQ/ExbB proton channel [Methanococcus vannielii SB]
MTLIPGSEVLSTTLHAISQSLLIPVIVVLLIFMIYSVMLFGEFMAEYSGRTKINSKELQKIITEISNKRSNEVLESINKLNIPKSYIKIIEESDLNESADHKLREANARTILEKEELRLEKTLEKTDFITRLGPTFGLMGTLIPMGPGLAALGAGDVTSLANAIIIAFDTTVVGLAAGGICYVISKIRRRWYEEQMYNLESILESFLEALKND